MFVALRKSIWIEVPVLLAASLILAVAVNFFRPGGIPLIADETARADNTSSDTEERFGISVQTAKEAWEKQMALFVDARSQSSYLEGHIPGAVNLPLDEVYMQGPELLQQIPSKESVLIVYCSDESCSMSEMLANFLRKQGYLNLVEMPAGIMGWEEAGLPVETGQ